MNAKPLIWNDLATEMPNVSVFSFLPPVVEMKRRVSGRGLALSTVIKLIFEGFAGMAYLTVFHASGAASD